MDLSTAQSFKDIADKLTELAGDGIKGKEYEQASGDMAKVFEQAMLPESDLSRGELTELKGAYEKVLGSFADGEQAYGKSVEDFAGVLNKITADDLPKGEGSDSGLKVDGNKIDTGRYEITCTESEVKIYDKETKTEVKAHGDPHLTTGDGDHAQFHKDNLTIDLQDGTKVTITPTGPNEEGISLIDKCAVTKGDEAVVTSGFNDGKDGVSNTGVMDGEGVADGVDRSFKDGTVLRAGDEVDDLSFTDKDGNVTEELKGKDETQKWGEHMLDGRGGASELGAEGVNGDAKGEEAGETPNSELFLDAAKNADDPEEKATHLLSALEELKDEIAAKTGKGEEGGKTEEGGEAEEAEGAEGAGAAEEGEISPETLKQIVELLSQIVDLIKGSQMPDATKDKMLDQIIQIMDTLGLGGTQTQGE